MTKIRLAKTIAKRFLYSVSSDGEGQAINALKSISLPLCYFNLKVKRFFSFKMLTKQVATLKTLPSICSVSKSGASSSGRAGITGMRHRRKRILVSIFVLASCPRSSNAVYSDRAKFPTTEF